MQNAKSSWPIPERRKLIEARARLKGLDIRQYSLITDDRNPSFDLDLIWI